MKQKMLLWILLALILANTTLALGATPAKKEIVYNGAGIYTGEFTIIPSYEAIITLETEGLNIQIENKTRPVKEREIIRYTIALPEKITEKEGRIIVKETPLNQEGIVGAKASIHYTITIKVPEKGRHLETQLLIHENGPYLKFTTSMTNTGTENLRGLKNKVELYDSEGKKATLYQANNKDKIQNLFLDKADSALKELSQTAFDLLKGETKEVQLAYKEIELPVGEYDARSIVENDELKEETISPIKIGEEKITIELMNPVIFINKTNKVGVLLSTNWNKELEGANVLMKFDGQEKVEEINLGKNTRIDIEVKPATEGKYSLKVEVRHADKVFAEEFDVEAVKTESKLILYLILIPSLTALSIVSWQILKFLKKQP